MPMTTTEARASLNGLLGQHKAVERLAEVLDAAIAAEGNLAEIGKALAARRAEAEAVDAESKAAIAADRKRAADAKAKADKAEADAAERIEEASAKVAAHLELAEQQGAARHAELRGMDRQVQADLEASRKALADVEAKRAAAEAALAAIRAKLGG
jgi:hypothetical protein